MENKKLFKLAALNSLGVAIYVFLVALFMNNASKIVGEADNKFISPVVFLLLFILSALVTSGLVLGRPLMMYFDGQKKESVKLVMFTGVCIFILLIAGFILLFLLNK